MRKPVGVVLLSKHPSHSQPPKETLEDYDPLPALMEVDIMEDVVQKNWLLCFGKASCKLREAVVLVACWLANTFLSWAIYQVIGAGHLIAFDRCPEVRL
eukprot:14417777-Ditylum_brightwellii.AAC.2